MKKILLGLGLLLTLASCGDITPGSTTPQAATISGTVVEDTTPTDTVNLVTQAWSGGAGSVIARGDGNAEIARGTLNADGSFSVTLPSTVSNVATDFFVLNPADLFSETVTFSCTGAPSMTDKTVKGMGIQLTVDANKDGAIQPKFSAGTVSQSPFAVQAQINVGSLVYSEKAVTVNGQQTCTSVGSALPVTVTLNYRATLQAGWNKVSLASSYNRTTAGTSMVTEITAGAFPTDKWVY